MVSVFHSRDLCYLSSEFFAAQIEGALEGLEVKSAVYIDINSTLPGKKTASGDFWLDETGSEFYNYILDHPLYHHAGLSIPLKNYHVLCLNEEHRDYILNHYPHIKSVSVMPIPGTSPLSLPQYADRKSDLLFQGSFISPETISKELKILKETNGSSYIKILGDLMDYWEPFLEPIEKALESYIKEEGIIVEELEFCHSFPELLNLLFPVDRIKRNIYREDILKRLSEEVPLYIMGNGWENSRLKNSRAHFIEENTYPLALQNNGKYKFVLDINPFFGGGLHDRMTNGFAAGCLVFSNIKPKENVGPVPGKDYISYEGDDITPIVNSVNNYNSDLEYVSAKGMSYWMDNLTWKKWAEKFLKLLS